MIFSNMKKKEFSMGTIYKSIFVCPTFPPTIKA